MGQQVIIVLQRVDHSAHKLVLHGKEKETRIFYNGWGFGRILPAMLLQILHATMCGATEKSWTADAMPTGCMDLTEDYAAQMAALDMLDFDKPKAFGEILKNEGNNNGGIFVRVTLGKDYERKIEYAYMLGEEEGGDYTVFCPESVWLGNFPDYIDEAFRAVYEGTVKYYGAVQRNEGEPTTRTRAK